MPDSRERELVEPTSSRKTGHQNYRDGNGEEPEEKKVQ
ncbi:hypothetical protein T06_2932 [Trichinella sp. T6]|nr:hypothetical protein T06_2932 [Trichinella sp. T6]